MTWQLDILLWIKAEGSLLLGLKKSVPRSSIVHISAVIKPLEGLQISVYIEIHALKEENRMTIWHLFHIVFSILEDID
jgi:hypothetical protein